MSNLQIHRKDMQGVFGHYLQRYVHKMVPQRPCLSAGITQTARYSSDSPDGQYEEEYSCRPPAIAMIIISIIEIILFMFDAINQKGPPVEGPAATIFIYNPYKRYEAWRYLTYMFVHVGWVNSLWISISLRKLIPYRVTTRFLNDWYPGEKRSMVRGHCESSL